MKIINKSEVKIPTINLILFQRLFILVERFLLGNAFLIRLNLMTEFSHLF